VPKAMFESVVFVLPGLREKRLVPNVFVFVEEFEESLTFPLPITISDKL